LIPEIFDGSLYLAIPNVIKLSVKTNSQGALRQGGTAMSGHNKWSKIKNKKGASDVKRGNLYTKLTREIIIATREGGADPDGNFRLRLAIQKARDSNMPMDNIDRAMKKGSGEGEGGQLIEMTLEGYGPGGTAILVNALSDTRNRTVQEVRSTFTRHGGSLAESGSVSWLFENKGVISIDAANVDADELALQAIDAGAEDVKVESGTVEVYTAPENLMKVRQALEKNKVAVASGELLKEPKTMVALDEKAGMQALKLIDKLESIDDVQNVYSNADISEAVMNAYQEAA
jgi:YebC/PmpR family DNA-binding regulatory protein